MGFHGPFRGVDINFCMMEDTDMSRFGILALTSMVLGTSPTGFEAVSYSLPFCPHVILNLTCPWNSAQISSRSHAFLDYTTSGH